MIRSQWKPKEIHFPPYNRFRHRRNVSSLSLLYHYCHTNFLKQLHFLVPQFQTSATRTWQATYTWSIHPSSFRIPLVRKKLLDRTDSWKHVSSITTILNSSNLSSIAVYTTYSHTMPPILHSFTRLEQHRSVRLQLEWLLDNCIKM